MTLDESRNLFYYILSAPIEKADVLCNHTGDTMHDHELRPDIASILTRETDFIRSINRHYPDRSDIRHFLSSGMNHNGLLVFRWKFHNDLILQIGWDRNNLQIFQRLKVSGSEVSSSFPVTWNGFSNHIPFDGSGEAMLTGQAADLLWNHVRECLGTHAEIA